MRLRNVALTLLATLTILGTAALAGPPLNGIYSSTDIGGAVNIGRYTEAWDTGGGALMIGTTLNAQSWDGANLGLQWRYECATIQSEPVLISDMVSGSGTGSRTYEKSFEGGTIWLSGDGPWGNGDPEYVGTITSYVEYETIQYVAWQPVHAVTNVTAIAHIDGYSEACMTFSVGNGVEIGSTAHGDVKPADYPGLLQEGSCAPVMTLGAWWDMMTLSLYIDSCTVGSETSTWGAVKAIYGD
jgi:hypothetical protein